jgi:transposase-like protein
VDHDDLAVDAEVRPGSGQTVDFYLFETDDREAANCSCARHVFARDGLRSYPAAIRELQREAPHLPTTHSPVL